MGLIGDFAENVAMVGSRFNGSVISWGRTVGRNIEVGGVAGSLHCLWLAADLVFDDTDGRDNAAKFFSRRLGYGIVPKGTRTLHVQALKPESRADG